MFEEGERAGKKLTPEAIAKKMISARNTGGQNQFNSSQYMTTTQIKSLVGRLPSSPKNDEEFSELFGQVIVWLIIFFFCSGIIFIPLVHYIKNFFK